MKKFKKVTALLPIANVCDKCKKVSKINHEDFEYSEFFHYFWRAGYGTILEDGSDYEIDLCQHCFLKAFGKYVRKVKENAG